MAVLSATDVLFAAGQGSPKASTRLSMRHGNHNAANRVTPQISKPDWSCPKKGIKCTADFLAA